jgi:hypothetical protein
LSPSGARRPGFEAAEPLAARILGKQTPTPRIHRERGVLARALGDEAEAEREETEAERIAAGMVAPDAAPASP